MSAVVAVSNDAVPATATEMKAHVQRIQQVMRSVMKEKTHYGTIPGTPKPSLWKAGAEVLCATFRIAPSYRIEDLSDHDRIRYRITCIGTHHGTDVVLGEGLGECSSGEEKYKWRDAVCEEEFDETDDSRKRTKWQRGKDGGKAYRRSQVRTEPDDLANTILKMAAKRAQVAMTINVTACSDIFTQDLEDMPEELRGQDDEQSQQARNAKPATQPPKASSANIRGSKQSGTATEKQLDLIRKKLDQAGLSAEDLCKRFELQSLVELPFDTVNYALAWIRDTQQPQQQSAVPQREPGQDG